MSGTKDIPEVDPVKVAIPELTKLRLRMLIETAWDMLEEDDRGIEVTGTELAGVEDVEAGAMGGVALAGARDGGGGNGVTVGLEESDADWLQLDSTLEVLGLLFGLFLTESEELKSS